MSLEGFSREVMGKPPKNRSWLDRAAFTDEDGCSYDQQVVVTRLPLGVGFVVIGGMLLVAWASDDPTWTELMAQSARYRASSKAPDASLRNPGAAAERLHSR